MSKTKRASLKNVIRFIVNLPLTRDEVEAETSHNTVSYSTQLNGIPGLASAYAHARFTATNYHGEVFVQYNNGSIAPLLTKTV